MSDEGLLLADTMVLTWYVLDPARLTEKAAKAMEAETEQNRPISVSAYSIVELVYMLEKTNKGITSAEFQAIRDVVEDPGGPFVTVPVDYDVALGVGAIPRTFSGKNGSQTKNADPGDRIIAATAVKHKLGILTSDPKIHDLCNVVPGLRTVWEQT